MKTGRVERTADTSNHEEEGWTGGLGWDPSGHERASDSSSERRMGRGYVVWNFFRWLGWRSGIARRQRSSADRAGASRAGNNRKKTVVASGWQIGLRGDSQQHYRWRWAKTNHGKRTMTGDLEYYGKKGIVNAIKSICRYL